MSRRPLWPWERERVRRRWIVESDVALSWEEADQIQVSIDRWEAGQTRTLVISPGLHLRQVSP